MREIDTRYLGKQHYHYCISRDRLAMWRGYIPSDIEAAIEIIGRLTTNLNQNEKIDPFDFRNIAVLDAHLGMDINGVDVGGTNEGNRWTYVERRKKAEGYIVRRVQNWVNKNDGDFDLLVVGVCNTGGKGVLTSKKSTLVHSTDSFYWIPDCPAFSDPDYLKVIVPGEGTY